MRAQTRKLVRNEVDFLMKSVNFEFLQANSPDLAALGGFAEAYAHVDPQSALVKLRALAERIVLSIYDRLDIAIGPKPNLNDLLNGPTFRDSVPTAVLYKLHALRMHGNKAAHGDDVSQKHALWLLQEAHDIARWFYIAYLNGGQAECPNYREPPVGGTAGETKTRLKEEKRIALEKLAAQEAQLNALLREHAAEQSKTEFSDAAIESTRVISEAHLDFEDTKFSLEMPTTPTRDVLSESGRNAANILKFNEAATRKWLIDSQLVTVNWHVGANGANTEQVTQEEEIPYQPTTTGLGYADYVLWDDNGRPLAVVEAKKTAESAEKGQTQARLYADGLEKVHRQRPVIFYTNGFDIWIWDDAQDHPPRKIFGFYSKDSLQYLVHQRSAKKPLNSLPIKNEIVNRLYQHEAIKRISELFMAKRRKALLVQATGTGKTRVAIALTELLVRAEWVKRVLFLCDRRELRKQAKNAFNDFTQEPLTIVGARTARDRDKRIYLATYPAMMKVFQSFDVGFFDLVIADESHRSIYNMYGDLFRYFDSLQVGLTATPVEYVTRNTFQLFECENQNPTVNYEYERAVAERYLVPFEVTTYQTGFLRRGIKYDELTDEQRERLEEQGEDPTLFDYEVKDVDKDIYNKDTNRHVIRNLMEKGIRGASKQEVGKSIIFARNHEHAVLLRKVFDEMYPQYGGKFCQVIDNYDPRAEQLIDDFKTLSNPLTIAISVDMLDTGIDVPEIVNLVFAKPVFSKVKFWQMIGRGTRLCKDLFGAGKDKTVFHIFDHWGNFDYFDFHYKQTEPGVSKSLMQLVFEARLDLAGEALQEADPKTFEIAVGLLAGDLNSLPEESIAVREKWRQKRTVSDPEILRQFDPATVAVLRGEIAPLMQWRNIRGYTEAFDFDLLVARMQIELLHKSSRFDDYKITFLDKVNSLQMHLNPVREKGEVIKRVRASTFWSNVTVEELEAAREELRTIIHHHAKTGGAGQNVKIVDIPEDVAQVQAGKRSSSILTVDMEIYRKQVEEVLIKHFDRDPVLQKIRRAEPVTGTELSQLTSMVLTQNPDVRLDVLREFYDTAAPLDAILRSIVGMEPETVRGRFETFVQKHPKLTAKQTRFLSLLENHIARYGSIEVERLYEDPFTVVDADGIDGVFPESDADELISIINTFSPDTKQEKTTK